MPYDKCYRCGDRIYDSRFVAIRVERRPFSYEPRQRTVTVDKIKFHLYCFQLEAPKEYSDILNLQKHLDRFKTHD